MKCWKKNTSIALFVALFAAMFSPSVVRGDVTVSYLYNLSNFTGTIPYSWPEISVDNMHRETYVISGDGVRIFNEQGMEIHRFGYHAGVATIYDAAVNSGGNIVLLANHYEYKNYKTKLIHSIDVYDYKGTPVRTMALEGLPAAFSGFLPTRLCYRKGLLYLAELHSMKVVVADDHGRVQESYDLAAVIGLKEEKNQDAGMIDFSVDEEGNILFTVPVIAKAYRVSPDRQVETFGKRGSAPGRFGIPGGIIVDEKGNYLVADTLRCVVLVFDKDFNFITEFGYRGPSPGNLVGPKVLAVDDNGRLYVSQLGKRGVSVFQLTYN